MNDKVTEGIGLGATCISVGTFLPQVIAAFQTQSLKDVSLWSLILLALSTFLWFWYGLRKKAFAVKLANSLVCLQAILLIILKLRFG